MSFDLGLWIKQTTQTTGTGTLSFDSAVDTGFVTFVNSLGNGTTVGYVIDDGNGKKEAGIGTITSGSPDTLSRDTVIKSLSGGILGTSKISFGSGTKTVACAPIPKLLPFFAAAPTYANDQILQRKSGAWTVRTPAQVIQDTGLSVLTADDMVMQRKSGAVAGRTIAQLASDMFPAWTTPTYASGNFTASGSMTWTVDSGDVTTYAYLLLGKTMFLTVYLSSTSVGGTLSNAFRIAIPGSNTAAGTVLGTCLLRDNGTASVGQFYTGAAGATYVTVQKADASNFSASTNNTVVSGSLIFPIQ